MSDLVWRADTTRNVKKNHESVANPIGLANQHTRSYVQRKGGILECKKYRGITHTHHQNIGDGGQQTYEGNHGSSRMSV